MITVLGVSQTLAMFALKAAQGEVAANVAADVMGDDVAMLARTLAPVATGQLRDSIENTAGHVVATVPYAGFVEYGTEDTDAQPFMRPAADEVGDTRAVAAVAAVLAV